MDDGSGAGGVSRGDDVECRSALSVTAGHRVTSSADMHQDVTVAALKRVRNVFEVRFVWRSWAREG